MIRVDMGTWGQTPEDWRRAALDAPHRRRRAPFQALDRIASGRLNATSCAAHSGRDDEAVPGSVPRPNGHGPDALAVL